MWQSFFALMLVIGSSAVCAAQSAGPMPFQTPAVSQTQIAFVYAGSVWIVDRQGGEARRLTSQTGEENFPVFSPDGAQIALSKNIGGNVDVYLVPTSGGELRRLTYHPRGDTALGWTLDGKNVLFASSRISDNFTRLYTISAQGGFPAELPLPMGGDSSFSPDGTRLAYMPIPDPTRSWRNYRGGMTSMIHIAKLSDSSIEAIPRENANDREPMWIGNNIYFLSDRTSTVNLFVYDTRTKKVSQLTKYEKYDIKAAAACNDAIVFVQGGALRLYELSTNQTRLIDVRLKLSESDLAETRPRTVKAARWIRTYNLSPSGDQALFGARGEVLTLSAEKSEARNLTNSSGVAERFPSWSPDGKWIAYFSDESGEYQLHLRPTGGEGSTKKIAIEAQPSFYEEPAWSPDSKRVAFSDKRLALWIVDLEKGKASRIDSSTFPGQGSFRPSWSADGKWLGYAKNLPSRVRAIFLYSIETGKSHQVSDGRSEADWPVFDKNKKYLYFTSSASAGAANVFGMASFPFRANISRTVQAVVLQKDGRSPLVPATAEDGGQSARGIEIEGIGQRIVRLPMPARNYNTIATGKPGVLFLFEVSFASAVSGEEPPTRTLHRFDLATRKFEKFVEDTGGFTISFDGGKALYQKGPNWAIVSTDVPPKAEDGRLDLNRADLTIDPRAEWKQIYAEAWRLMRDYFYDPNHHGQNLVALKENYAAYLPNIITRNDLNYVFREMFSHITVSHMQIGGGETPPPSGPPANVGLLGADYEISEGRYRITRIYRGDNSGTLLTAPLTQPGVNVQAGDFLLAVDGQEIVASENLYKYFQGKAGRPSQIKIGPKPNGDGARTLTIIPLQGENTLRDFNEIEENRRKVTELSGGKLGYIYLPDTGVAGYTIFNRDFHSQLDKQGVIIDERFNSGGAPADYFIEALKRQPLSYYTFREGDDFSFPQNVILGPRVMIINEFAGSGGDTLPWMFRAAGLGTLVGKRTWGGGIGGYVGMPPFVDGGQMLAPNRAFYNPRKGALDIENHGVAPDIEVDNTPAAWRAGRDPQLERAVQVAIEELKKNPPPRPLRPKLPIHK
jgi:tricorn protease